MAELRPDRTLGPRHDDFWAWCDAGEFRLQHCANCGARPWPVVDACEICGSSSLRWEPLSGRGKVTAWCSFERDYYRGVLPMPWDTILVELEEGPLFLSNPRGFMCDESVVGLQVKACFIACEDAAGPFKLPVFERDHDVEGKG